jgi:hypothetical protein
MKSERENATGMLLGQPVPFDSPQGRFWKTLQAARGVGVRGPLAAAGGQGALRRSREAPTVIP